MSGKRWVFTLGLGLAAACNTEPGVLCGPGPSCSRNTGIIYVSPTALVDSASVTAGPQRLAVRVANIGGGALIWKAFVLHGSAWLTLPIDSGRGGDSLVAQFDPAGLSTGDHRDTVVVNDELQGGQLLVPVDFRVIQSVAASRLH